MHDVTFCFIIALRLIKYLPSVTNPQNNNQQNFIFDFSYDTIIAYIALGTISIFHVILLHHIFYRPGLNPS